MLLVHHLFLPSICPLIHTDVSTHKSIHLLIYSKYTSNSFFQNGEGGMCCFFLIKINAWSQRLSFFLVMRTIPFSGNGDFYPPWIRQKKKKKKNNNFALLATAFLTTSFKSMPEVTGRWISLSMFWDFKILIPSSLTPRAMSSSFRQSLMLPVSNDRKFHCST